MLSGLKIKFKNANDKVEEPSESQKTTSVSTELTQSSTVDDKKWKSKNSKNSKMAKRKYDFGKEETPTSATTKAAKYDFSKATTKIVEPVQEEGFEEEKKTIGTLEELRSEVDNIWDSIKQGKLDVAGNSVFDLDTNINKWLYNLKDTANMFSTDPGAIQNEKANKELPNFEFSKTGKGFLDSQKADLEKYEDGDYKSFLKKMEEKKLKKETRILSSCRYCLENSKLKDYEVLTVNNHFYLLQPGRTSFPGKHLILVPVDHVYSSINIKPGDEAHNVYLTMKSRIIEFYKTEYNCSTLIYETAMNLNKVPHCKIEFFAYDSSFDN